MLKPPACAQGRVPRRTLDNAGYWPATPPRAGTMIIASGFSPEYFRPENTGVERTLQLPLPSMQPHQYLSAAAQLIDAHQHEMIVDAVSFSHGYFLRPRGRVITFDAKRNHTSPSILHE